MNLPSLEDIAYREMEERGFEAYFPEEVLQEATKMEALPFSNSVKDLRHIPFFSIDNETSLDLDQLTFAESLSPNTFKAVVAIADVDSFVKVGTAIDNYAGFNTTSVYTPTKIFTMLPPKLSNGLTSLLPKEERLALIIEVAVDEFGETSLLDISYGWVSNHAKLVYDSVAPFLEHGIELPIERTIADQLLLQDKIAQKIKQYRLRNGALELETIDAFPLIQRQQVVAAIKEEPNRARELIENFMIAANLACNHFLKESGYPRICRIVKTPKNWPRIVELAKERDFALPSTPDPFILNQFLKKMQTEDPISYPDLSLAVIKLMGRGEYTAILNGNEETEHFGLSLKDYTHATAPNRRYVDLIMGRLIKAAIYKKPSPYSLDKLQKIALQCSQKEADADKVERKLNKCAIARLFVNRIGENFRAIVTGASERGTWVRILAIPVEGKLVKFKSKADVGDKISVKLLHVDPLEGFIDFAEI